MRICRFAEGPFKPSGEGATLCFLNFGRVFSNRGHDVIFLHAYQGWSDPKQLVDEPFYTVLLPDDIYYNKPQIWLRVIQTISPDLLILKDADRIVTHGVPARLLTGAPIAWEVHDIPAELSAQFKETDTKDIQRSFAQATSQSDLIWTFTQEDTLAFDLSINMQVKPPVIPPFIDLKVKPVEISSQPFNMVFIGNNYYEPNLRALFDLHKYLIPAIDDENMGVLNVYGNTPPHVVKELEGPHMVFHGYISNLRDAMLQNVLAVVPVRFASGIRIKTLTFLSYGIPVLSTTLAKTGIECPSIFVEDDVTQFGKRAVEILANRSELVSRGKDGREWLENNFGENVLATKLEDFFSTIANTKNNLQGFQHAHDVASSTPMLIPGWLRENIEKRRFSKPLAPLLPNGLWAIAGKGKYIEFAYDNEESWLEAKKTLYS